MSKNCEMTRNGNKLTITVDLTKEYGRSSTGKTVIVASSEGNISCPGNEQIKVGVNIYKK